MFADGSRRNVSGIWSDSMVYASDLKDFTTNWCITSSQPMSLMEEGWLGKANAPMLCVNGGKGHGFHLTGDHLAGSSSCKKAARIMADGKHMGRAIKREAAVGENGPTVAQGEAGLNISSNGFAVKHNSRLPGLSEYRLGGIQRNGLRKKSFFCHSVHDERSP